MKNSIISLNLLLPKTIDIQSIIESKNQSETFLKRLNEMGEIKEILNESVYLNVKFIS